MSTSETEFARIFESGKYLNMLQLSDANLQTDDGCNFDIHRLTLATSSAYFNSMFLGMDKRRRKFHIPGISGECLSAILCYIYIGNIQITERNIIDLIKGSDYLLVDGLQMEIKYNIENVLTEVNCLKIIQVAHEISDDYIFRKCFRFIQTRFERIMQCREDELADLPLEILGRILSNRSLCVCDETTVWLAIVAWTQKDIPLRMSYVPQLLSTLAIEDIGERLATEILQHEIISENSFMKDLVEIPTSNDSTTNLDVLLTFLRSFWDCFTEPISHRIPLQLRVAWNYTKERNHPLKHLYITYDENADLFRKMIDTTFWADVLIPIRHNIYSFETDTRQCWKFDLSLMEEVRMESFKNYYSDDEFCIVATDPYIYILGRRRRNGIYDAEVYDTANNSWRNGVPPGNISHVSAVAIGENIYVVGNPESSDGDAEMVTQMFDPDTQEWSIMSPPIFHHLRFSLVAYHQKIYLIGVSNAEVFDPATNLWRELPGALHNPTTPKAWVIKDQIVVCDTGSYGYCVCWNNAEECWEKYDENFTHIGRFLKHAIFCTVDNVETIKMIMKKNRDPETQMEYIHLF